MKNYSKWIGSNLSEIFKEKVKHEPIFFIKTFSNEEYRRQFINGSVYCNTFKYFMEQETLTGKGLGDSQETVNTMYNVDITAKNPETNEIVFKMNTGDKGAKSKWGNVEYMHLFCVTSITLEWFKISNIDNNKYLECDLVMPQNFEKEMANNFGENLALFPAHSFISNVEETCKIKGINVEWRDVTYLDYSTNPKERVEAFFLKKSDFYFQKDISFKNQFEFRFIFPNLDSKKAEKIKIADLIGHYPEISTITDLKKTGLKIDIEEIKNDLII